MLEQQLLKHAYVGLGRYFLPWLLAGKIKSKLQNLTKWIESKAGKQHQPEAPLPWYWRALGWVTPNWDTPYKALNWTLLQPAISEIEKNVDLDAAMRTMGYAPINPMPEVSEGFMTRAWNAFTEFPTLPYQWLVGNTKAEMPPAPTPSQLEKLVEMLQALPDYPGDFMDGISESIGMSKTTLFCGLGLVATVGSLMYYSYVYGSTAAGVQNNNQNKNYNQNTIYNNIDLRGLLGMMKEVFVERTKQEPAQQQLQGEAQQPVAMMEPGQAKAPQLA